MIWLRPFWTESAIVYVSSSHGSFLFFFGTFFCLVLIATVVRVMSLLFSLSIIFFITFFSNYKNHSQFIRNSLRKCFAESSRLFLRFSRFSFYNYVRQYWLRIYSRISLTWHSLELVLISKKLINCHSNLFETKQ